MLGKQKVPLQFALESLIGVNIWITEGLNSCWSDWHEIVTESHDLKIPGIIVIMGRGANAGCKNVKSLMVVE